MCHVRDLTHSAPTLISLLCSNLPLLTVAVKVHSRVSLLEVFTEATRYLLAIAANHISGNWSKIFGGGEELNGAGRGLVNDVSMCSHDSGE